MSRVDLLTLAADQDPSVRAVLRGLTVIADHIRHCWGRVEEVSVNRLLGDLELTKELGEKTFELLDVFLEPLDGLVAILADLESLRRTDPVLVLGGRTFDLDALDEDAEESLEAINGLNRRRAGFGISDEHRLGNLGEDEVKELDGEFAGEEGVVDVQLAEHLLDCFIDDLPEAVEVNDIDAAGEGSGVGETETFRLEFVDEEVTHLPIESGAALDEEIGG